MHQINDSFDAQRICAIVTLPISQQTRLETKKLPTGRMLAPRFNGLSCRAFRYHFANEYGSGRYPVLYV
ncbi:hypothetical protein [Paraburkholderia sp. ZP32-5]|uniref:hypothetical protein n=1 Tax=Paraburkholderia sp. ZP32-5 TaxID=2883245 RepID=UPI001F370351|nr:hypothetical protein [Paraburkholderia sp. ZP32-5]